MSRARKIAKRRDRRKAKASGFRRAGKSNPKKVGHGGSGMKTSKRKFRKTKPVETKTIHTITIEPLTFRMTLK